MDCEQRPETRGHSVQGEHYAKTLHMHVHSIKQKNELVKQPSTKKESGAEEASHVRSIDPLPLSSLSLSEPSFSRPLLVPRLTKRKLSVMCTSCSWEL